jgi:hypothetical protein
MTDPLPPLAEPSDLAYLPGAPFSEEEVTAASAAVRTAARWHIAPVVTETVSLDVVPHDRWLRLPTGKLTQVTAIHDADTDELVASATYRVSRNLAQVKRSEPWPCGYERVEVTMVHGYESTPVDLFPVIAQAITLGRRDPTVQATSIDDYSVTYTKGGPATSALVGLLGSYALDDAALYGMGLA